MAHITKSNVQCIICNIESMVVTYVALSVTYHRFENLHEVLCITHMFTVCNSCHIFMNGKLHIMCVFHVLILQYALLYYIHKTHCVDITCRNI